MWCRVRGAAGAVVLAMADSGVEMKTVAIRAPANAVPGGKVKINHQGHEVIVTYPSDVIPGQEIQVQVPKNPPEAPQKLPPIATTPALPGAPDAAAPTSGGAVRPRAIGRAPRSGLRTGATAIMYSVEPTECDWVLHVLRHSLLMFPHTESLYVLPLTLLAKPHSRPFLARHHVLRRVLLSGVIARSCAVQSPRRTRQETTHKALQIHMKLMQEREREAAEEERYTDQAEHIESINTVAAWLLMPAVQRVRLLSFCHLSMPAVRAVAETAARARVLLRV